MRLALVRTSAAVAFLAAAASADAEVVVLTDGSVQTGTVEENPSRSGSRDSSITVTTVRGPMVIPQFRVEVRADSMLDAYEQLAERMTTQPQRLTLGRWCLKHHLMTQAEEQFRQLNADMRAEALEEVVERREQLSQQPKRKAVEIAPKESGRDQLGPEVAASYRTRIAPLLKNGCGMAACHGPAAEQDLRLQRGNRQLELQTAHALLQRIDRSQPLDSPLLDYAARPHGGASAIATDPVRHPERYGRLREWAMKAAAAERFGDEPGRTARVGWRNGAISR